MLTKRLVFILVMLILWGCNNAKDSALQKDMGITTPTPTVEENENENENEQLASDKSTLLIVGGNNQSILQNATASNALEVLALDTNGEVISGVTISFKVMTSNGGTLTGGGTTASAQTDDEGKASIAFTAGNNVGSVTIVAKSNIGSVSFTQTITSGVSESSGSSGSTLIIIHGNNQILEQNTLAPQDLEVIALNSSGTAIEDEEITFTVLTSSDDSRFFCCW